MPLNQGYIISYCFYLISFKLFLYYLQISFFLSIDHAQSLMKIQLHGTEGIFLLAVVLSLVKIQLINAGQGASLGNFSFYFGVYCVYLFCQTLVTIYISN